MEIRIYTTNPKQNLHWGPGQPDPIFLEKAVKNSLVNFAPIMYVCARRLFIQK